MIKLQLLVIVLLMVGCLPTVSVNELDRPDVPLPEAITGDPTPTPTPFTRPDAVNISSNFCICLDGQKDIINNCEATCANLPETGFPELTVNMTTDPDIELNPEFDSNGDGLGDVAGWCNNDVEGLPANPGCVLRVKDQFNNSLDIDLTSLSTTTFKANVQSLIYGTTYLANLVETSTGAISDTFQLNRKKFDDENNPGEPFSIKAINQYSCLNLIGLLDQATDNLFYLDYVLFHFYFSQDNSPPPRPPIPFEQQELIFVCHDINTYGTQDNSIFPRLNLWTGFMYAWDNSDPDFFDINPTNNIIDANETINQTLLDDYNITTNAQYFFDFSYSNSPDALSSENGVAPILGIFMQPFIDSNTEKAFCPKQEHYNGDIPVFKVMKELVGVDTEGVYFGVSDPQNITDTSGQSVEVPDDIIIINESLLKQIWFYLSSTGVHIWPDENTAESETIRFYWPPCIDSGCNPHIKQASQVIYTIRASNNLSGTGQTGIPTTFTPPDKRFGCIPSN